MSVVSGGSEFEGIGKESMVANGGKGKGGCRALGVYCTLLTRDAVQYSN
jgi:hypothetical protein